jgi:hypothetical protein
VHLPIYRDMGTLEWPRKDMSGEGEIEISEAAINGYGQLLRATGRRIVTHASTDGGLICEDRTRRARPVMWRISGDGAILPDSPYSFLLGTFVAADAPVTG